MDHKLNVGTTVRDTFKILDYKIINHKPHYYIECGLCGTQKWMRCDSVFNTKVVSCGCYNKKTNYLKSIDITNVRSGSLVAIRDLGTLNGLDHVWECKCDCGKLHNVPSYIIKAQRIKSCGCRHYELNADSAKKAFEACKSFIKDGTNYKLINNTSPNVNNSTGEKLIHFDKSRCKYVVQVRYKGVTYNFGRYDDMKDAIIVRDLVFEARKNGTFYEFLDEYKK